MDTLPNKVDELSSDTAFGKGAQKMRLSTTATLAFAIAASTVICGAATAATRTVPYPIYATNMGGGASFNVGLMSLPHTGAPGFTFTIVLPDDYKEGGPVKGAFLYVGLPEGANSCTAVIVPGATFRARFGRKILFGDDGLGTEPANGDPSTAFASEQVTRKVFHVKPVSKFPGMKKGDVISLSMERLEKHPLDTCPRTVSLISISMEYQVDPNAE